MPAPTDASGGFWKRARLPLLEGVLPLDRSRIGSDVLAGVTLAALGIPEVMGYTKILGVPVILGLYTILLPMLAFAVFGSSRHLVVGADSATAAMVASALVTASLPAFSPKYVAMTGLVALVCGAMLLAARLLRLGFLADFLSRTVLIGFLTGVGVQVAVGELHALLGIPAGGHGFFGQLRWVAEHLGDTQAPSFIIALIVLAVIVGFDVFAPRFPGALLAVVGMIVAGAVFHLGERGIALVGTVPSGLPHMGLPDVTWSDVSSVIEISFSCFIVILAQSAATSRAYALKYHDAFDQNTDLVGLGLANAAAGLSGTFVVNGSPTKTAMVDTAGGRSQISHLTTACVVLLVLLFLTGPLGFLPDVVLSSIVFLIGVKLTDFKSLALIWKSSRAEFWIALLTAAVVVGVGVKQGILLALVCSLLYHVQRGYRPPTAVILSDPKQAWKMAPAEPGQMILPGMVMYWFGGSLYYANASRLAEESRRLVDQSPAPVRWFVLEASAIPNLDYTAAGVLRELQADLSKRGVVLAVAMASTSLEVALERNGLAEAIGRAHIFPTLQACLDAYRAAA
jgi:sulfate permease, SulP family